jgi:hypothetical protein
VRSPDANRASACWWLHRLHPRRRAGVHGVPAMEKEHSGTGQASHAACPARRRDPHCRSASRRTTGSAPRWRGMSTPRTDGLAGMRIALAAAGECRAMKTATFNGHRREPPIDRGQGRPLLPQPHVQMHDPSAVRRLAHVEVRLPAKQLAELAEAVASRVERAARKSMQPAVAGRDRARRRAACGPARHAAGATKA